MTDVQVIGDWAGIGFDAANNKKQLDNYTTPKSFPLTYGFVFI